MAKTKGAPPAEAGLNREEILAAADLFQGLTEHPGWRHFIQVLGHHRIQVGIFGHSDLSKRPGYYEGFLDGIEELGAYPDNLTRAAAEIRKALEQEEEEKQEARLKREKFKLRDAAPAEPLPFRTPVGDGDL